MSKSIRDHLEFLKLLQGEHQWRVSEYDRYASAYDSRRGGFPDAYSEAVGSYADGRPALRDTFSARRAVGGMDRGAPNIIKSAVRAIVTLRAQLPSVNAMAEGEGPEEQKTAEHRTAIYREQWRHSRMAQKMGRLAWYDTCFGDGVLLLEVVTPDDVKDRPLDAPGVHIHVVDPRTAYPVFRYGGGADDLEELYIVNTVPREVAARMYGVNTEKKTVDVIVFYDKTDKLTIVDGRRVGAHSQEHGLGFCPAEWHVNEPTDGMLAQSDIAGAVELQQAFSEAWNMTMDGQLQAVYPLIEVNKPEELAGETIPYGPGATIITHGQGQHVYMHSPAVNVNVAQLLVDISKQGLLNHMSVSPVTIEGIIDRSNVSGRSVSSQLSPMEGRIVAGNERLGETLVRMNAKMALMLSNVKELREAEMPLYGGAENIGQRGRGIKGTVAVGSYRGSDMDGWVWNRVKWDALMGMNRHERLLMALQLHSQHLIGGERVLEEWGDEEPEATMNEARAFFVAQQQAQTPPQQPGQGGPPPQPGDRGAPDQQALSMQAGGMPDGGGGPVQPGPPAMQQRMPGFPPVPAAPQGGGMGSPGPTSNPLAAIQAALGGLQLQGTFEVDVKPTGGFIVRLSSQADRPKVAAAVAQLPPTMRPQVVVGSPRGAVAARASSNGSAG